MISFKKYKPKILVVGDLMIDQYLWGSCNRISPEAPVQVININEDNMVLGGAGNVINNLHSLDAKVDVISVIGECAASKKLVDLLSEINIDTKYLVIQEDRITSKKTRIISAQQQVVRFDRESGVQINFESQDTIIKIFNRTVKNYDVVLLSDYGKGVLTSNLTQTLINIANKNSKKVLVDPKGLDFSKYKGAFLMTPNKKEASDATNIDIKDNPSLTNALIALKEQCDLKLSLITLSEEGVAIFDHEVRIHPTAAREVYDVTGAGDTVLASLGFALSCNKSIDQAVQFANLASGVVVGKIGSATATIDEIIEYESSLTKSSSEDIIKTPTEISSIVKSLKNKGRKIVFTNGCFDILHVGHIKYLEEAKRCGDILIVGLNSDRSINRIKGNNRPINNQNDRGYLLASLEIIDYVVIFDEDTPIEIIKLILPDVLVKGGDYKKKKIVGEDFAKEFKVLDFIEGKSTTNIINKIQGQ